VYPLLAATLIATVIDRLEGEPVDVADVLDRIERILSNPIYAEEHETFLQRILGPVYTWLERMIAWAFDTVTEVVLWVLQIIGTDVFGIVGPIILVLIMALGIALLARRRAREIERRATIERILELGTDPSELEARAGDADEHGDHAEAIRLRFVAGLLRLDQSGMIDFYPGLSNGAISAQLGDPTFDRLAAQFDRVVYGRRAAGPQDSQQAAADWAALQGARR
jgi:hypothetical protein